LNREALSSIKQNERHGETELEAIRKADSEWLTAVQSRDLETLAKYYHEDATWLPHGEPALIGKEAILRRWSKAHEAPGFQIDWSPLRVEASDSLDLGVSIGNWVITMKTKGSPNRFEGSYVAVWRRHVEGDWRVLVDISN